MTPPTSGPSRRTTSRGRGSVKSTSSRAKGTHASGQASPGKTKSASRTADDEELWLQWCFDHFVVKRERIEKEWQDDKLQTLLMNFTWPEIIKSKEFCSYFAEMGHKSFGKDASNLQTVPEDPHGVGRSAHTLATAWKSFYNAWEDEFAEAGRRRIADTLIELAFDLHKGGKHRYCVEADMVLRRSTSERTDSYNAIADGITFIKLPVECLIHSTARVFSWSSTKHYVPHPISFIFEAKARTSGIRQLVMYFTTAQNHRRAVGLSDIPVFGATLEGNHLKLYVSVWTDDLLEVLETDYSWSLTIATEVVKCYIQLSMLADYIYDQYTESFNASKDTMRSSQAKQEQNPWRRFDRKDAGDYAGPDAGPDAGPQADPEPGKRRKRDDAPNDADGMPYEDSDATLIEARHEFDGVVQGKVNLPSGQLPLTQANLTKFRKAQKKGRRSPTWTERMRKWAAEAENSTADTSDTHGTQETLRMPVSEVRSSAERAVLLPKQMLDMRKTTPKEPWVQPVRQRLGVVY